MSLHDCLPPDLRGPDTLIARVAAGMSGAGVYRVDRDDRTYILKVTPDHESLDDWRRRVEVLRSAAESALAPRVLHVDEARRAVLTEFVEDRSFPQYYRDPRTHAAAVASLGDAIRGVHALPIPAGATMRAPRAFLSELWHALPPEYALPPFVGEGVRGVLTEASPAPDAPPVLSHNDVNPSNLVYDGERVLLLDWDVAALNDRWYDLAVASLFLRMCDADNRRLVGAYRGETAAELPDTLPDEFHRHRRLAGVLAGVMMLTLARQLGHPGATAPESLHSAPSLVELYAAMRSGALTLTSAEGRWTYGLALMREGLAPSES